MASQNFFDSASALTVSLSNIPQFDSLPAASGYASGTIAFDKSANRLVVVSGGAWVSSDIRVGDVVVNNAGTIGSVSDPDAIAISATGDVSLTQDLSVAGTAVVSGSVTASDVIVGNNGNIGSVGETNSIAIASNGDVTFSQTVLMTDSSVPLHVKNFAGNPLIYAKSFNSRVGIGTSTPEKTLDVIGDIRTSTGILFGTDTAAANMLDDYEEGTWTPEYIPTTGAFASVTYTVARTGFYTKIGRVVWFQAYIDTSALSVGTASGALKLGGLPFNIASLAGEGDRAGMNISYTVTFAGDRPESGRMIPGTNQIALYYRSTSNGNSLALDVSDMSTGNFVNQMVLNGFYIT